MMLLSESKQSSEELDVTGIMSSTAAVKKMTINDDLGEETGYVSDSSLNSRRGTVPKQGLDVIDERLYVNKRKTKSERDKRRSSRVSLIEQVTYSESENSSSSLEQNQPRYRKRANSKRHDNDNKEIAGGRRRAGSKNASQLDRIESIREPELEVINSELEPQLELIDSVGVPAVTNMGRNSINMSTTTLKMNSKDIYFGTWNPKERAVLDQVLNNIDLKPDHRRSFRDKIKIGKDGKRKERNTEIDEEEVLSSPNHKKTPLSNYSPKLNDRHNRKSPNDQKQLLSNFSPKLNDRHRKFPPEQKNLPSNYTPKLNDRHNRKSLSGLFSGLKKFKNNVLRRHDRIDEQVEHDGDDPLQEFAFSKKKKGIFKRLGTKKKDYDMPRKRAQSTNDYVRSVTGVSDQKTNLSKQRSGSTHSLKSLFTRTKSVDNLNGAFEFYANQNQVFQRTPSMQKLDKFASMERLNIDLKRSGSQKSLSHGFEAVQPSARELCYNEDSLVFVQAKVIQPARASQVSLNRPVPRLSYDIGFDDDLHRGYQSDCVGSGSSCHSPYNYHQSFSDAESSSLYRPQSSRSAHPAYFPHPRRQPNPPAYSSHYHHHYNYQHLPQSHGCCCSSYNHSGYASPECFTPGAITPDNVTPRLQRGYSSETNHGHMAQQKISMVPYYARRAIERSLSKNSAASNYSSTYGYQSESSYCDDEDLYEQQPSIAKLQKNLTKTFNHGQLSTVL